MNIKEPVYEKLTPRQRIAATFDALARDDAREVDRLKATCPRKSYSQNDAAYADTMEALMAMSIAIECDLRGYAISCVSFLNDGEVKAGHAYLRHMKTLEAAWFGLLGRMGIRREAMQAVAVRQHPMVEHLLSVGSEPDSTAVERVTKELAEAIPATPGDGLAAIQAALNEAVEHADPT